MVLDFDNPVWDNDTFTAWELNPETGRRVEVERIAHRASNIPEPVRHVWKIHRYLVDVADSLASHHTRARYADVDDALWVQTALDDIGRQVHRTDQHGYVRLFAKQAALVRIGGTPT